MSYLRQILCVFALFFSVISHAQDAEKIISGARLAATLTHMEDGLQGMLTQGRKQIPITLFLKGKDIQFQFTENGKLRIFHMRLSDDSYQLFEMINGKTIDFPASKLSDPIAGTDLTYEDLALRFFYWPMPIYDGAEDVAGQGCHRIRLNKPKSSSGRYEGVYVWIHAKYGAFMRIRGHDKNGGLVKEFQVEDVMKVSDDVWVLKKMQVSTHDPKTGKRISISDVTFKKPSSTALRGLR